MPEMSESSFVEALKALSDQGAKEDFGLEELRRLLESMSSVPDPATSEKRVDIEKMVRGYQVFLEMVFALRGVQLRQSSSPGLDNELKEVLEAMPAVKPGMSNVTSVEVHVKLISRLLSSIEEETALLFRCLSHLHPYMVALAKYDEESREAEKALKKEEARNKNKHRVKAFFRFFHLL